MMDIIYDPNDVGKEFVNNRGKNTKLRKYHMTEAEMDLARNKWSKEVKKTSYYIKKKAGEHFFNPYRKGVYYYQIYAMFLLGANKWHSLGDIIDKMEEIMSNIIINKDGIKMTSWEKFKNKSCREASLRYKDHKGRVQENMIFFQRLNKLHPTGYKLMQVKSAVDMKRTSRSGFPNGCYFYRLSTYSNIEKALPVRDFKNFNLPVHEGKYVNYKFVGTIITRDKVISEGVLDEVSQM